MSDGDMPQHKGMAMGKKTPSNSGPPTKDKYREGGSVHGSHGHGRGVPGHDAHGHKKMPGK